MLLHENGALFLRLAFRPHVLIRRNCPPNTLLETDEFENAALRFSVERKHFENGALTVFTIP